MASSDGRNPEPRQLDWISDRKVLKYLTDDCKDVVLRINVEDIEPPTEITRESSDPDLGKLGKLPTELLNEVLGHMDFRSLLQFSATSLLAKSRVSSLPAYRDVTAHASKALNTLAQVKLLGHFSAAALHQTFKSDRCASCHGYGQYLHLLLCERACGKCLKHNQALWVLSGYKARQIFDLKQSQLKNLPALQNTPKSGSRDHPTTWKSGTHYSVKMLKKLALKLQGEPLQHESLAPLTRFQARRPDMKARRLKAHLRAAAVDDDARFEAPDTAVGYHEYALGEGCYKDAAVSVCHIGADRAVSHGYSCKGCDWVADGIINNAWYALQDPRFSTWPPDFTSPLQFCKDAMYVARSKAERIEHVRGCTAVGIFLRFLFRNGMCLADLDMDEEPDTSDEEDDF